MRLLHAIVLSRLLVIRLLGCRRCMTLPRDQLSGLSLVRLAGAVVTSRGGFSGATVFLTFSIRVKTIFSLPFILIYVQVVDLTLVGGVCFLP